VDRGSPAFPRSELSGEEWTDSLASIRPVGITVSGPFDSGIDRLWSVSFLIVHSLVAKGLSFAENRLRALPERCSEHAPMKNPPADKRVFQCLSWKGTALSAWMFTLELSPGISRLATMRPRSQVDQSLTRAAAFYWISRITDFDIDHRPH
jgi:hypothetical protein